MTAVMHISGEHYLVSWKCVYSFWILYSWD